MFESRRIANVGKKRLRVAALLLVFFALMSVAAGLVLESSRGRAFFNYLALFLFLLSAGLVAATYIRKSTWAIGAEGEEIVERILGQLNRSYRVVHDVVLPRTRGNIDHVVLGPNGVFIIETKNHNGAIICDGDIWEQRKIGRRGTPYLGRIGCPSRQVKGRAALLNNFFKERLNMNLYVNAIVVFTNPEASLSISNPTVTVLRPDQLAGFLMYCDSKNLLRNETISKIEQALAPYSQFHMGS